MTDMTPMRCRLKQLRSARDIPQNTLAAQAGLTRQALGAIESGRYVPNTAVALKLARLLGCRVEDIFDDDDAEPALSTISLAGAVSCDAGTRVAVAAVRQRLVGFPLDGDAALDEGFAPGDGVLGSTSQVRLHCAPERLERTALLLGCDPAFPLLGAAVARSGVANLTCRFAASGIALAALERGEAHLAGTHLHCLDREDGDMGAAQTALASTGGVVMAFSSWEQGLMVVPGNPKSIRGVADLADPRVVLVNREPGSGSRRLLDDLLARAGIANAAIRGYHQTARSHLDAARRIAAGLADAAIGLRAVAVASHLDFVPLCVVRCDLVIPADLHDHPAVTAVLDALQTRGMRADLSALPGYDTTQTGRLIASLPTPN